MKISLKTKIAFWLWQKFRFKEPENKFQKISTLGTGIRSLLIILPRDSRHLSLAQHFLKSLESRGQFSAINKIIGWEEQKDILDSQLLLRVQLISEKDYNKYGLITNEAIKRLARSEEHTSELQSHSFISYAVFCLKKKIPFPLHLHHLQ